MSCMFFLCSLQILNNSDSEVLDFSIFSELDILDFLHWNLYPLLLFWLKIVYDTSFKLLYWLQLNPCQHLTTTPFLPSTVIIVEHYSCYISHSYQLKRTARSIIRKWGRLKIWHFKYFYVRLSNFWLKFAKHIWDIWWPWRDKCSSVCLGSWNIILQALHLGGWRV